jgi:replication factor A1
LEVLSDLGEAEKIGEPKPLENKLEEDEKPQSTTISSNGFYGAKAQNAAQRVNPQPQTVRPVQGSASATIYPIEALSPYAHKWTIKARCTSKSAIKTWHGRSGDGTLFSVNLLDDSGEIRATAFNDQCTALYDLFQEGGVYYISSPCRVAIAKKQFTNLNNDYELTFERDTLVEKVSRHDNFKSGLTNFGV